MPRTSPEWVFHRTQSHEMALMDGNILLKLPCSFTLRALTHTCSPCSLFSLQPSHHCSVMWHPISWTPRAQWSPNHLKLVTVYVLMLLVSLSFASGQSRPFKHQIDNRSKYESHLTWWPHSLCCTEGSGLGCQAKFNSKSRRCFCGVTLVWGPVLPFVFVCTYTEPLVLLTALN